MIYFVLDNNGRKSCTFAFALSCRANTLYCWNGRRKGVLHFEMRC